MFVLFAGSTTVLIRNSSESESFSEGTDSKHLESCEKIKSERVGGLAKKKRKQGLSVEDLEKLALQAADHG